MGALATAAHLGEDVLVPEMAGWRRERMPVLTDEEPYFTLAPDWVAEVLSPDEALSARSGVVDTQPCGMAVVSPRRLRLRLRRALLGAA